MKKAEDPQLSLGLAEPYINRMYKYRRVVSDKLVVVNANPFMRESVVWLSISIWIIALYLQYFFITKYIGQLPPEIPFYTYLSSLGERLGYSTYLRAIPFLTIGLAILSFAIAYGAYNQRKHIAYATFLLSAVCGFAFTVKLVSIILNFV